MMPLLSIIVPIYNIEDYLEECLESICSQTYEAYEVILVNDGSTDNSEKIVDSFIEKYPQKCKGYSKENGGLSDARNYGLNKAKGEYIGFVDGDDYIDVNMFLLLMQRIIETGADVAVCNTVDFYMENNTYRNKEIEDVSIFGYSIEEQPKLIKYISASACNKIYKRELFDGIRFPKGKIYEDFSCIYNVLLRANKIECVNQGLYYYRHGRSGAISSQIISKKIFDIFDACNSFINFFKEHGSYMKCYSEVEYACILRIYFRIWDARNVCDKNDIKLRWQYVNEAFSFLNSHFPNWRKNKYLENDYIDIRIQKLISVFLFIRTKKYLLQIVLLLYPIYNKLIGRCWGTSL